MVPATYFDGRRAQAHPVTVTFDRERVQLAGAAVARDDALSAVVITDRIGNCPRLIRFSDGAHCEVTDLSALDRVAGIADSRVARWERSTRMVALAVLALALTAVFLYFKGVPAAASVVADRLPSPMLERLSHDALRWLDIRWFDPSLLAVSRRQTLLQILDGLRPPGPGGSALRLEFRRSPVIGANALALPSGVIVITDELVYLSRDDREIAAVLAHEVGHVVGRHSMRRLAQSAAITLLLGWYAGDVSMLAIATPTILLTAQHTRELEQEADDYAAKVLAAQGIPAAHMVAILERLEKARGSGVQWGYLSTHPATAERLARLRGR